jgi:hypothetical protein
MAQCIREKMDVIDIDDDTIDAGVLDSMAVTQVCAWAALADRLPVLVVCSTIFRT